jgi:hypothetical protein
MVWLESVNRVNLLRQTRLIEASAHFERLNTLHGASLCVCMHLACLTRFTYHAPTGLHWTYPFVVCPARARQNQRSPWHTDNTNRLLIMLYLLWCFGGLLVNCVFHNSMTHCSWCHKANCSAAAQIAIGHELDSANITRVAQQLQQHCSVLRPVQTMQVFVVTMTLSCTQ